MGLRTCAVTARRLHRVRCRPSHPRYRTMPKTPHEAHHEEPKKPQPKAAPPAPQPANVIRVTEKGFDPHEFAAKVGEPVKWVNESGNSVVIEFDDGLMGAVAPPSSPELTDNAATYEYTFIVPGGYKFHAKDDKKKTGVVNVT